MTITGDAVMADQNNNDLGNACAGLDAITLDELRAVAALYDDADGLLIRLATWAGERVESAAGKLPDAWQARIAEATDLALRQSYDFAFSTQGDPAAASASSALSRVLAWAEGETWHVIATGVTGALGGLGGIATTLIDLPVTTTLILRSIQQIASGYGEDLADPAVRAQCVAVFGLAGPLAKDDAAEVGLFTSRLALNGKVISEMLKLVLARYSIVVGEKVLAQATPVLGAFAGGAVNPAFTSFYQTMAHVHFRLRRLERDHDADQLRACFERIVSVRRKAGRPASIARPA